MRCFLVTLCLLTSFTACKSGSPVEDVDIPVTTADTASSVQEVEKAMEIRIEPLETSWDKDGGRWNLRVQVAFTNRTNAVFALDKVTAGANGQIANDVFEITAGGEKIAYRGMMMKRAHPGRDGFFHLQPGQTHTEVVDLGEDYALPEQGGTVSVRFDHFNHFSDDAVQLTSEPVDIALTPLVHDHRDSDQLATAPHDDLFTALLDDAPASSASSGIDLVAMCSPSTSHNHCGRVLGVSQQNMLDFASSRSEESL